MQETLKIPDLALFLDYDADPTLQGSGTSLPTPSTWTSFAPLHLMFGSSQEMLIFVCVTSFGMADMAYLSSLDMVVAGNYSSTLKCDADLKKMVFQVSKHHLVMSS